MSKKLRTVFVALLSLLALGLAVACSPSPGPSTGSNTPAAGNTPAAANTAAPVAGGQIVFGLGADIATTIPILSADSNSASVIWNIFDALDAIDPVKLTPIPWLATSWDIQDNGMSYVFHLTDKAKFHDGKPLTAADVKYTMEAIIDPKVNSNLKARFVPVTGADVIDEHTVKIKLNRAYAPLLFNLASMQIMPKHIAEGQDLRTGDFVKNPVGSGPYKFKEWKPGDHITLVANTDYWQGKPNIDTLIYRIIPSADAMLAALKTGEVDVAGVSADNSTQLANDAKVSISETPSWCFQTGGFNLNDPRFQDKRVRQAFMYSLDREQIVKQLLLGHGYVADSYLPKQSWAFDPNVTPVYRFDLAKAKSLMTAAGWTYNSAGIAEKDGKPFKFTLLSSTGIVGVNEAIQKAMKDIGMDVDIQLMDFPTFLAKFATEKRFDFITITACVQIDPDNPLVWGCNLNAYGFCSKQFDDWGTQASQLNDLEGRKTIYAQMQKFLADEVPRPILWSANTIVATNNRLNMGTLTSANYSLNSRTLWSHQWSVKK